MMQQMDQMRSCKYIVYSNTSVDESDDLVYIEIVLSPLVQLAASIAILP